MAIDVTNTIAARFLSVYELKREETEVLSLVDKNLWLDVSLEKE